ncbi:M15 family metallopeptidase [Reinekea marinisedimentorum]|uniref:D-alanyl-D-alanine dipeptidase n=1 Tax=Reinekea marinisedimentorum TaxID=230495 RepID=A0A4R3HTQ4_9GAMM|nr:M15 family metallopeptidase [Reinekea marinisedimentorum]TCS35199.1 D-alanyl-D-alanine dipeptidase [Reinekea marinisedimentorum]
MNLLDDRVLSIEVIETGQDLISIPDKHEKLVLDHDVELGYENEFVARKGVVSRLIQAANRLPFGTCLSIKETYRPKEFQELIFNRRASRLSKLSEHSGKSELDIHRLTSQFIAPPEVAGHPTGGAVDVALITSDGNELDLGCNYDEDEQASNGRCFSFSTDISREAQKNRQVLFNCMRMAGFVNYPFEWWHWSYGDKYWAAVTGASNAIYGAIGRN